MRAFKSYKALTSMSYRIVGFLIFPVVLLAVTIVTMAACREYNGLYPEYFLFACMTAGDAVLDYLLFGGICCREGDGLELVRSSRRGLGMLEGGIAFDMLRRFGCCLLIGLVCYVFTGSLQDLVLALAAYLVITGVLNLTRHTVNWQVHLFLGIASSVLFSIAAVLLWLPGQMLQDRAAVSAVELAVCLVLAAAVSAATAWHMSYCLKRSYYEG